eukprot:CAMPEP_0171572902 /NCGR_PEP_ID=MMETSP0961-20121227/4432_1 /TAXON_ID=87120 /ORGANISM="Aurantiochytrium limacinum, Strain ATCCMYA-1381" /LENGTH=944 /DNA_ID=CAMNT_0012127903 /DNA_START=1 /DNA_END=2831 /DNA_ORIENTATION=-
MLISTSLVSARLLAPRGCSTTASRVLQKVWLGSQPFARCASTKADGLSGLKSKQHELRNLRKELQSIRQRVEKLKVQPRSQMTASKDPEGKDSKGEAPLAHAAQSNACSKASDAPGASSRLGDKRKTKTSSASSPAKTGKPDDRTPNLAGKSKPSSAESASSIQHEVIMTPVRDLFPLEKNASQLLSIINCDSKDFLIWKITTVEEAQEFVRLVQKLPPSVVLGCDTEASIDLELGVVNNGYITCVSVAFPTLKDYDLVRGLPNEQRKVLEKQLPQRRLCAWIDVLGDRAHLLDIVKPVFESGNDNPRKVWQNYTFDFHMLANHNIKHRGLAGDTMHMGRLVHNGRIRSFSLSELSSACLDRPELAKISMKNIFGERENSKDAGKQQGKSIAKSDIIQVGPLREAWIEYSCLDSVACLELYFLFQSQLRNMNFVEKDTGLHRNLLEVYEAGILPFAQVLADIERAGFQVDLKHLSAIEKAASEDLEAADKSFRGWLRTSGALKDPDDADLFNTSSSAQRSALLFSWDPKEKKVINLKDPSSCIYMKDTTSNKQVAIRGLGLEITDVTATKAPATGSAVQSKLVGKPFDDPPKWGTAYEPLESQEAGRGEAACKGLGHLIESAAIQKLLTTFIAPLKKRGEESAEHRIHTSLKFNTETGRLSASNPNLQNQPALEKDRYGIRKAFISRPGNNLIVADYGQLELRVLAHLANCVPMIKAFEAGGDFHSRTALSMFDYIEKDKEVILEWDKAANGGKPPPYPLIKDKYASERRQAKVLNFSIAYGKTAFGLSKDFGVSLDDAKDIVARWYSARPEVDQWQKDTINFCRKFSYVETIWGRRRFFPKINSSNPRDRSASERGSINTPIQGSAADIVMSAMIKLHMHERFREIGWQMVLQVHDEIIAEGPEESTDEAMEIVRTVMENPMDYKMRVDMIVDANVAKTWYEA